MRLDHAEMVAFFNKALADGNAGGKVVSCVVIPDYKKLLDLENRREKVMQRYSQFHEDPPKLKCFCSKSYLTRDHYDKEMTELDNKIDGRLCREIKVSRTAFVCVDSLQTVINLKKIVK